jgi:hypothetical protein
MSKTSAGTKRKTTTPPDGYVCSLCHDEGHWIQQCPQLAKQKKKKSNHVSPLLRSVFETVSLMLPQ